MEVINLTYIHFTDEQKQRAASVDLEAFLRSRGERLISSGRDKRLASDHSVTIRGNEWYDHAEEKGGTAISFVQRYYGIGYAEAVSTLLGDELGVAYPQRSEKCAEAKPFALPPASKNMHRVFAYLCKTRGIAQAAIRSTAAVCRQTPRYTAGRAMTETCSRYVSQRSTAALRSP